jgi:hypothetical protein
VVEAGASTYSRSDRKFLLSIGYEALHRLDGDARNGIRQNINNIGKITLNGLSWGTIGLLAIRLAIGDDRIDR